MYLFPFDKNNSTKNNPGFRYHFMQASFLKTH